MAHAESRSSSILHGVRDSAPVVLAVLPFGVLFGALSVANGLTPFEAVLMSATIFAGASQMVGIDLFGREISPALIIFALFAVNFRHVLYSAAIGRRIAHWPSRPTSPASAAISFCRVSNRSRRAPRPR